MANPVRPSGADNTTLPAVYPSGTNFLEDVGNIAPGEYRYPEPINRALTAISGWIDEVTIADADDARIDAAKLEGIVPAESVTFATLPLAKDWTNITLASGFSAYGSPYHAPQYCRDKMGFVHLRGRMTNPSYPSGYSSTVTLTGAFLLSGNRPSNQEVFQVRHGAIEVYPTGGINILAGSTSHPFLDGISFYAG